MTVARKKVIGMDLKKTIDKRLRTESKNEEDWLVSYSINLGPPHLMLLIPVLNCHSTLDRDRKGFSLSRGTQLRGQHSAGSISR